MHDLNATQALVRYMLCSVKQRCERQQVIDSQLVKYCNELMTLFPYALKSCLLYFCYNKQQVVKNEKWITIYNNQTINFTNIKY